MELSEEQRKEVNMFINKIASWRRYVKPIDINTCSIIVEEMAKHNEEMFLKQGKAITEMIDELHCQYETIIKAIPFFDNCLQEKLSTCFTFMDENDCFIQCGKDLRVDIDKIREMFRKSRDDDINYFYPSYKCFFEDFLAIDLETIKKMSYYQLSQLLLVINDTLAMDEKPSTKSKMLKFITEIYKENTQEDD